MNLIDITTESKLIKLCNLFHKQKVQAHNFYLKLLASKGLFLVNFNSKSLKKLNWNNKPNLYYLIILKIVFFVFLLFKYFLDFYLSKINKISCC